MNSTPLKYNTKKPVPRWIVLVLIALAVCLSKNLRAQTPTKPNHVTISELAARNALKYKLDAEYWYQISVKKDTIIVAQDTIISTQKKKIFWQKVEIWAGRGIIIVTTLKLFIK